MCIQGVYAFVLIVLPSVEGHRPSDLQRRDWKLARVILWYSAGQGYSDDDERD